MLVGLLTFVISTAACQQYIYDNNTNCRWL